MQEYQLVLELFHHRHGVKEAEVEYGDEKASAKAQEIGDLLVWGAEPPARTFPFHSFPQRTMLWKMGGRNLRVYSPQHR